MTTISLKRERSEKETKGKFLRCCDPAWHKIYPSLPMEKAVPQSGEGPYPILQVFQCVLLGGEGGDACPTCCLPHQEQSKLFLEHWSSADGSSLNSNWLIFFKNYIKYSGLSNFLFGY